MTRQAPGPDTELVKRLRAGDPSALAQAYDQYADAIFRIGYRLLGETADAEDLVQDVFAGLARALRTFEGRGSFENWLKRVASRTALSMLRQQRVRTHGQWRFAWPYRRRATRQPAAEGLDLHAALQQLDAAHRAVFVLKDFEGCSHEEIAKLLGISVGAARVRLYRARRRIRAYLESD
jgi:RNA polymerase sigma-70 factor (ECF subfamily)